MLKDISSSLLLAGSTDLKRGLSLRSPLELKWIKAITRRGILDMKAEEFTCASVYNSFVCRKMASYEESEGYSAN